MGSQHPLPENIPHLTTSPAPFSSGKSSGKGTGNSANGFPIPGAKSCSPVEESSFLQRETSQDDGSVLGPKSPESPEQGGQGSPPAKQNVPSRWQD